MNYFSELQERIREIRLSERFFYQKIKDIYTTSIDYKAKDEKNIEFFKVIQNKLLWAISQQTAGELLGQEGFSIHLGMSIVHKSDEVVTLQTNLNLSSFFSNKLDKSTIFTLY